MKIVLSAAAAPHRKQCVSQFPLSDRGHRADDGSDERERETNPSLESLMELYQQANSEATIKLIGVLTPLLYRFLASQLGNRLEVDDLLQDVFLKIHQSRHTYRPDQPLLPWVFAIARHVRVSDYRRRYRTSMREVAVEDIPQRVFNCRPDRHGAPGLPALIAGLPYSQREVLILLKVNELGLREAAKATSSRVGAVKQKAYRVPARPYTPCWQIGISTSDLSPISLM